jgi:peptide maturation system acyl carrier-related protein
VDRKKVDDKVKLLFINFFQKDESKFQDSYCTDNFFGSKMGLLPGDVLAYLYAIEKEFGLQVPSSYILEGKFNTLDNVTDIICEVIQKKDNGTAVC